MFFFKFRPITACYRRYGPTKIVEIMTTGFAQTSPLMISTTNNSHKRSFGNIFFRPFLGLCLESRNSQIPEYQILKWAPLGGVLRNFHHLSRTTSLSEPAQPLQWGHTAVEAADLRVNHGTCPQLQRALYTCRANQSFSKISHD